MLCNKCGKNPAAEYTVKTEEGDLTLILCSECYRNLTRAEERKSEAEGETIACPACGTTMEEFRRTGLLGCAHCYTVFREELSPAIMQIQGKLRHEGKSPDTDASQNYRLVRELETLREEMERLLREKNFSAAEKLNARLLEINHKLYRGEKK